MNDLSFLVVIAGHYDESLYWALRAVPRDPNRPWPYYHVSLPLILLGDDEATERWLTRAAHRFPDVARLGITLAWLDCLRGRDKNALARARQVVAAHPEDEEAQSLLMNVTFLTGASDAESVLEPLYRGVPGGGVGGESFLWQSYRTLYGLLLARRGQRDSAQMLWQAALSEAERRISGGNDSFSPRLEIASIHAVRGDTAAALDWLDRAYQAGWHETRVMARDPFFAGLRGNQRYREIVARAQADVDAMRRRATDAHAAVFRAR
jgi:tetratricopeptide (TPR) repeat protein